MVVEKEILSNLKEKCEKAYELVNDLSKNDPPTDPFRSHYSAQKILIEILESLKNSINSEEDNSENQLTYKVILAFIYRDLGRISIFTEEIQTGENYLQSCLELIEEHHMKPEVIMAYVGALNELGIALCNRKEVEKSLEYLIKSENAYLKFKETGKNALSITDIFGTPEEVENGKGPKELEKLYTLCTFYLAQVYGLKEELDASANYCHTTLVRQMNSNDYESIDWALNAATLSQYFLNPSRFRIARHHLAAANLIIDEYETTMYKEGMSDDKKASIRENFKHRYADIARCWAKYGLVLLSASKDRLMIDDEKKLENDVKALTFEEKEYEFEKLNLSVYETQITDQYCLTIDDATIVFRFIHKWLDIAKEFYTLESHASEYAKIISDYAESYKFLAFFDEIPSNQSKMHKRRVDLYEDLLKMLNPTYYLNICQECWYECGLAYCSILDVKLEAIAELKFNEVASPHALKKINSLCDKGIKNFQMFINSYKMKGTDIVHPNISEKDMQIILYCYFHIGRLYYKYYTQDKVAHLENLQNCLKYYQLFVDTCAEKLEASKALQSEIGVCKEMITLLPYKIKKVSLEIPKE